jgi:hypothetical protein
MSAQDFVIAHGEKVLVLLAALGCGYYLYGTFANPEIRPTDISMEKINDMVSKVETQRGNQAPPVMKAPSTYLDDMLARWAVQLPSSKYYALLSAATDVGPPDKHDSQFYIYELQAPQVTVTDNIGNLDVTITLPASQRSNDARISDAASKTWTLEGRPDNKAQWLGVQIEFRVGAAGDWQPLAAKDVKGGLLKFKEGTTSYTVNVPTVEPWQRHYFRARLIAKATGLQLDQAKSNDQKETILVYQGAYPEQDIDWAKFTKDIGDVVGGNKALLDRFLKGSKEGPFAAELRAGESLYRSSDSIEASVIAIDSIRFVFDKVMVNPTDPMQNGAQFLLTKFMRDPKAADKKGGKWLAQPLNFKTPPGEGLGGPQDIINPFGDGKLKINVDFTTPYVLTAVKDKVKRILFYEIYAESRPNGGKAKNLNMKVKEVEGGTEVAILTNTKTNAELPVPKCEKITKPNKPQSVFYPDFPNLIYDEAAEFKKNPATFKQNPLIPKEPIKHEPDTGPLEDMRKATNDPLLKTDTQYFEVPDGRIVYWEFVNHRMVTLVRAGSEFAAEKAAADKEAADKAAAEKEAADKAAAEKAAAESKEKEKEKEPAKETKDAKPATK